MIPILLKGHERSITYVTFNYDGDLLFSCSKDSSPTVWWASTGERLGTYEGHSGTVWTCAPTRDSNLLLTGSADNSAKLWKVASGECLFTWEHHGPVRVVAWAEGEKQFLTITDTFASKPCQINVYDFSEDLTMQSSEPKISFQDPDNNRVKITSAGWLPVNQGIVTTNEKGQIRIYNPTTGECTKTVQAHNEAITSLSFNPDKTLMITSSVDMSSRLWDVKEMRCLKRYVTNTPLNTAAISPLKEHVLMGGGQEARDVTTTAAGAGKFETRFFDMVTENEFGRVKGHFGPLNTLAFHPSGHSYASGAEDGYVRLHHFDQQYYDLDKDKDAADVDEATIQKALDLGIGKADSREKDEEEMQRIPLDVVQPMVEAMRASKSGKKEAQKSN
eukprot:gb/GECG01007274.1/.p1 GENE.gb/GECG01007274.1/~~gb/GECG01007274.1/.p1  ORF type:complete len:389 (+),score=43.62 gb/GECG01007274.1/:1-1167(+)